MRKTERSTPAGLVVRIFIAISLCWFFLPWLLSLCCTSGENWYGRVPWEAKEQLRSIRHRLEASDTNRMNEMFYEGKLFTYTFYGFSLVNTATANPSDAEFKKFARQEIVSLLPKIVRELDSPQFSPNRNLKPVGGVILAGQANLMRAGYVLLGGDDPDIVNAYHEVSSELHQEFMSRTSVSLESYPQMIWPVDNCCALESIRLHDTLFGTGYSEACKRWEQWMTDHLDPATKMMVAQISSGGDTLEGSRGCALSWSLAFMPGFAPDLAHSQYDRYRREWFIPVLGTTGIREWPPGQRGYIDPDTGPIVFGIGGAASGFGIAAAKANGDSEQLTRMLRGLELTTVPLWSFHGKHMFGGLILLADEISLWGKTIRVWDAPASQDQPKSWPPVNKRGYWLVMIVCITIGLGMIIASIRSVILTARAVWLDPNSWSVATQIMLVLNAAICVTWMIVPQFHWPYAILGMGIVDILERRVLA